MRQKLYQSKAYRLIALQAVIVLVLTLAWGVQGHDSALSALAGGLVCILPNLYFAKRFFSRIESKNPGLILRAFYSGEFTKLVLLGCLVWFFLIETHVALFPFFTGFIGAHMGFWIAPLIAISEARMVSS